MRWIILALAIQALCSTAWAGESSYNIKNDAPLMTLEIEASFAKLQEADSVSRQKIATALDRMRTARTSNERKYHELDYYEQSAIRVQVWVRGIKSVMNRMDSDIEDARSGLLSAADSSTPVGKAEIEGVRKLLALTTGNDPAAMTVRAAHALDTSDMQAMRHRVLTLTYLNLLQALDAVKSKRQVASLKRIRTRIDKDLTACIRDYRNLKKQFRRSYG